MANIRPVAEVEIDDPAVDGRIVENYHHYARNWLWNEAPDSSVEPQWWLAGCELIGALHAVAPIATVNWDDADLDDWNVEVGGNYWGTARPSVTRDRVAFLHYSRAEAGTYGSICSSGWYPPAIHITLVRCQPVDGESYAPRVELQFLGTGYQYGLILPSPCEGIAIDTPAQHKPQLLRWEVGDYDNREVVGTYEGDVSYFATMYAAAYVEQLQVEQIGDYLRLRLPSQSEDWIIPNAGAPLTRGALRVSFYGGAGMFNAQRLDWVTGIYYDWLTNEAGDPMLRWDTEAFDGGSAQYPFATPRQGVALASWLNTSPAALTYAQGPVGVEPAGCSITAEEYDDNRPLIHFVTPPGSDSRPALQILKEWRSAAVTPVAADAETIYPDRVTWHRDNTWRNARFDAYYTDFDEEHVIRPNARAELKLCWDDGDGEPSPETRVIGYVDGTHWERVGSRFQGQPVPQLRALGHIAARLQSRKFMRHMCSFENWTAEDIFEAVLAACGVDDTMITVDAAVDDSYTLPENSPPWDPAWDYANDYEVIRALDEMMVEVLGLQWGWDASGYFLRPKPTWESGDTPDWTLDYDEADTDDVTVRIVAEEGAAEFRNYVMRLAGHDENTYSSVWRDRDSHYDDTDHHYIGDDAWEITGGDENQTMASYMAARRLQELAQYKLVLEIETHKLDLAPDEFVEVNAGLARVPDGSVFRVLEEDGEAEGHEVGVTFTLGLEELGE